MFDQEQPDDVGVSVSYPLPGTKFYETVKAELGEKTRWVDSDDLAMMFRGRYVTPLYRHVRHLLHDEVRHPDATDLDRRWSELEREEPSYRVEANAAAAVPPDAGSG